MVDFLTQNSARQTATIAKIDVNKLLLPCLYSAIHFSDTAPELKFEGLWKNCPGLEGKTHLGLTITNTIGKFSVVVCVKC